MRELSLHILDIVQNSLKAGSRTITIEVIEDLGLDRMEIRVKDDGKGMSKEISKGAADPFYTTRKTRKVGLGLAMFRTAAEVCDGYLEIDSVEGKGTDIKAVFRHSHIDRIPLGDMSQTISLIVGANPYVEIIYFHRIEDKEFKISSTSILNMLEETEDECSDSIWVKRDLLSEPKVISWIKELIKVEEEHIQEVSFGEISGRIKKDEG